MASCGRSLVKIALRTAVNTGRILKNSTGSSHVVCSSSLNFNNQFVKQAAKLSTSARHCHASGVRVQHPAPNFQGNAVVDGQFKEIKLDDFKGKYLVLFFYPLDFTFVCPTEIIAFSERMAEFQAVDTHVVGVSTDSHFSHLAWINQPRKEGGLGGLKYPLLADFNKNISEDYGVLVEGAGVALRGLFIIDPSGVVRQITINDLPVGRSVDETLRLVKAFQFTDKHGEVCPANWTPEAKTIKPNPTEAKEYFESVN